MRVSGQEVWPFAAQSAFFICTRGWEGGAVLCVTPASQGS
ncbi:hypothetical protein DESPIG_00500 [Desulfovibrio piger ATCC 29098]|uniref:Uncharacterized protein n=1 Tax=Desulfovibrio piger ATCC 29098 TaxID=411464 RepID=B6WR20_9BACT|nr:hypothetical protein DESPIG_00500 [Desulfovibrio piger ATCC 29098]